LEDEAFISGPTMTSWVCITGASSGIGEATAIEFARHGSSLILLARRKERLDTRARDISSTFGVEVHTAVLDVRNREAVAKEFAELPARCRDIDVLVNNAGLSRGLEPLHAGSIDDWEEMIDTNIKGLLYVTRAVLPGMVARNRGHIINIGSTAGHQTYPGGNVYSATKHAVKALNRSIKMDLLGTNIRVTSVDPGLVETEFSNVRFHGDRDRAAKVYAGMTPLHGPDIAEIIYFCATRPPHVAIQEIIVTPTDQAHSTMVHRKT
jgi:3-hydroxy acid dehydrogenase / malonic semialdehyde reductase